MSRVLIQYGCFGRESWMMSSSALTALDGQIEGQRGEMVADDSEDELSAE
ncbi:hypothetical protein J007_03619 [Cryptococcus neoformans]|nr:hypothetical protein J007_03619 [Cryptococcus neoformans var. grubii]OXC60845.1 hypothetical protein C358_03713 [Cryptococcus neoformans var. grubii MW-RSA852]